MRHRIRLHLHAPRHIEDEAVPDNEVHGIVGGIPDGDAFIAEIVHHAALNNHVPAGSPVDRGRADVHGIRVGAAGAVPEGALPDDGAWRCSVEVHRIGGRRLEQAVLQNREGGDKIRLGVVEHMAPAQRGRDRVLTVDDFGGGGIVDLGILHQAGHPGHETHRAPGDVRVADPHRPARASGGQPAPFRRRSPAQNDRSGGCPGDFDVAPIDRLQRDAGRQDHFHPGLNGEGRPAVDRQIAGHGDRTVGQLPGDVRRRRRAAHEIEIDD